MARKISEIRRPEIVSALERVLAEEGMSLPGYDRIAKHGDMSRQLVRHYFPNPDDLMMALCEAMEQVYRDCLVKAAIASADGRRLQIFLDFLFDQMRTRGLPKPKDDAIYDALLCYAAQHEPLRQKLHDGYELVLTTFAHEIQVSYPELPQRACRELGYMIVATMYGHWKMVATVGFSDEFTLVARQSMDRLIESYVVNYVEPEED